MKNDTNVGQSLVHTVTQEVIKALKMKQATTSSDTYSVVNFASMISSSSALSNSVHNGQNSLLNWIEDTRASDHTSPHIECCINQRSLWINLS